MVGGVFSHFQISFLLQSISDLFLTKILLHSTRDASGFTTWAPAIHLLVEMGHSCGTVEVAQQGGLSTAVSRYKAVKIAWHD